MTIGRLLTRINQAAGGYGADLFLYASAAAFALVTARTSTLLPHRAWGTIALWPYTAGFLLSLTQWITHRRRSAVPRLRHASSHTTPGSDGAGPVAAWRRLTAYVLVGDSGRAALGGVVGGVAALLPLIVEAAQRAGGRSDRAQEEVLVVEIMGERLLHDGTPYLAHDAIAALPAAERLMAYSPYQPGMAIFGLPRAIAGDFWWTDARVWFALVTVAALAGATCWSRGTTSSPSLVRAIQSVAVLPICALTLATGGDDLPVLALCLLALSLAATDRYGWSGVAVGAAAACKLFAFPVVAVLIILALSVRRGRRFLPGALGLPILVLIPPFLVNADAFTENVLRFPLGHGLVVSPAQSPFPGYLIAQNVPAGRYIAAALLAAVAIALTVRIVSHPPRTSAAAASIIGSGLLAAILLMPTTRFGYLLYPIAFLAWAPALRHPATPTAASP